MEAKTFSFYKCIVYDEDILRRCADEKSHIHAGNKEKKRFNNVKPPAIVFLQYNTKIIAYGEFTKIWVDEENNEKLEGWIKHIKVNGWYWKDNGDHEQGVDIGDVQNNTEEGKGRFTIRKMSSVWGLAKMEEINPNTDLVRIVDREIKKIQDMEKVNEYVTLLKSNHNLILTGAPGTGKTYLAKDIAKAMGAETEFVQFHPSYDYTDFVEGLRPINKDGNVGFERQDGIFKRFCKKALNNLLDSRKSEEELTFEEKFKVAYEKFFSEVTDNTIEIPLKTGKKIETVGVSDSGNIYFRTQGTQSQTVYTLSYTRLLKLSQAFKNIEDLGNITNIYNDITKQIGGCFASAFWATLRYLYENYYGENVSTKQKVEAKNFVFIIDEINRGDISKILGELFFAIDPGYRGEKGKVQTQYQNLIEKGDDIYDDGFYVPENVYIIGTMNDIDRSVESMDFAMRRRFAWKEITAESQISMLDKLLEKDDDIIYPMTAKEIEKVENRLKNLNDEIVKEKYGLSTAYHIGPSYFLKLGLYETDRFESLWNNHIKGVLYEYLRGNEKIDDLIEDLLKAYNNDQDKGPKKADKQEPTNEKASESEA